MTNSDRVDKSNTAVLILVSLQSSHPLNAFGPRSFKESWDFFLFILSFIIISECEKIIGKLLGGLVCSLHYLLHQV